jgi:hypothetical protein
MEIFQTAVAPAPGEYRPDCCGDKQQNHRDPEIKHAKTPFVRGFCISF